MAKPWHTLTPEEAMKELHVSEKWLSQPEAQRRLAQCGPNELQKEKRALDWAFAIFFTAIIFDSLETAKWITSRRKWKHTGKV